jgi:predicted RNA binding protein YcfA (HicA-like mRNA interferase family)
LINSTAALLAVVDRGFRQCGIGMAKISALLDQVIEGRGVIKFRDLERLLTALGFHLARTSGSHRIYIHPAVPRPLSIQRVGNDAKPYQLRQLRDIIREYGLKLER